jgi:hypothetical protein
MLVFPPSTSNVPYCLPPRTSNVPYCLCTFQLAYIYVYVDKLFGGCWLGERGWIGCANGSHWASILGCGGLKEYFYWGCPHFQKNWWLVSLSKMPIAKGEEKKELCGSPTTKQYESQYAYQRLLWIILSQEKHVPKWWNPAKLYKKKAPKERERKRN